MKKGIKITMITALSLAGLIAIGCGGYLGYVFLSYNRIGDKDLYIEKRTNENTVKYNTEYAISTYNIGFGAYSQDFTFFLDDGYDENGNKTIGHGSRAKNKETVLFNVNGAIDTIKELDVDFALFQEVDIKSTRSYKINQNELICNSFTNFDYSHCINFHSPYLAYPLNEMHGKVNAGLTTLAKFSMTESKRYEYTISSSFSKIFDLDRCFQDTVYKMSDGKKLHIVNSHMSAYDKGGTIRAKQLEELNAFLEECKKNNDYVIVGGDYNHDLLTNNPDFSYDESNKPFNEKKKSPDWISYFFNNDKKTDIVEGYTVVASDNSPTCRNNDIEWEEGKTYTCVVDGFIVSNNIEIIEHKNIRTKNGNKGVDGFAYSDHEPAYMKFKI